MNEKDYLIWLSTINGIGPKTIKKLINYFGSALAVWNANSKDIYNVPNLSNKIANKLINSRNNDLINQYKTKLKSLNVNCITSSEDNFPQNLANIYEPPHVLYVKGKYKKEDELAIAIVGARNATPYGRNIAYKFAKELAGYGITIISGMAYGIDTAAHKGAIDGGGRTIAVLGCGVDICYPKSNFDLMKKIFKNGAVVSEYPLGTAPIPGNFPRRNRIVSGLSKSVLVVEAGIKSGSLITVDYALDQGKDIFSVPGNILSKVSEGTNKLIKEGAKPITCVEDILEEFNIQSNNFDNNIDINLSDTENLVFNIIKNKQPINLELIASILQLNIGELNSIITILELKGLIEQLPGKILIIK